MLRFGGDKRDRAAERLNAIQALSRHREKHTPGGDGLCIHRRLGVFLGFRWCKADSFKTHSPSDKFYAVGNNGLKISLPLCIYAKPTVVRLSRPTA